MPLLREQEQRERLKSGQAKALIQDTVERLTQQKGRWFKIYYGRCRPDYLYHHNKGAGITDARITMRQVAACLRGHQDYYYAMMLMGGVAEEFTV